MSLTLQVSSSLLSSGKLLAIFTQQPMLSFHCFWLDQQQKRVKMCRDINNIFVDPLASVGQLLTFPFNQFLANINFW